MDLDSILKMGQAGFANHLYESWQRAWAVQELWENREGKEFGGFHFQRFLMFINAMRDRGFNSEGTALTSRHGYIGFETRVMPINDGKYDDVISIRGLEAKGNGAINGIRLLVNLSKSATESNVILMGCPRGYTTLKDGGIAYEPQERNEKLIGMYKRLGWVIHPTLKSEPHKLDIMTLTPKDYKPNPYPYKVKQEKPKSVDCLPPNFRLGQPMEVPSMIYAPGYGPKFLSR